MAQLILEVEDNAQLLDLKRAGEMFRGVISVTVKKETASIPNKKTIEAIKEAKRGNFAGELDVSSKETLKSSIMAL